jgi:DNA-binding GntR family transcriptional regulator
VSSLSQDIATRIGGAILAHRLTPGTKLGERELGEALGASRIVIRQALIRLAEDGLVRMERNRGAFVASPTLQEAIEVYEALILVEQGMVARLCDSVGSGALATLSDTIERQRQATDSGDQGLADRLGMEFHAELIGLGNNRVIAEMHEQLNRRSRLLHALYTRDYDRCGLCDDHDRLARLIGRRQAKRARDLIDEHYRAILRGFRIDAVPRPALTVDLAFAVGLQKKSYPAQALDRWKEIDHVGV